MWAAGFQRRRFLLKIRSHCLRCSRLQDCAIRWQIGKVVTGMIKTSTSATHCGKTMAFAQMSDPEARPSTLITHGNVTSAISSRGSVAWRIRCHILSRRSTATESGKRTSTNLQKCHGGHQVMRRCRRGWRVSNPHHCHQSGRGSPPRHRSRRVLRQHLRHRLRATAGA